MYEWQLKRDDTNEVIELPAAMRWVDESNWSRLAQTNPLFARGGSQVIQQSEKLSGRPITLASDDLAWIKRGVFLRLQAWSEVKKLTLTLTRNNVDLPETYKVYFRNHEEAVDYEPVIFEVPETNDDKCTGSVRLMTA